MGWARSEPRSRLHLRSGIRQTRCASRAVRSDRDRRRGPPRARPHCGRRGCRLGENTFGQARVPRRLDKVRAIAAGSGHNLAIRVDGSVLDRATTTEAKLGRRSPSVRPSRSRPEVGTVSRFCATARSRHGRGPRRPDSGSARAPRCCRGLCRRGAQPRSPLRRYGHGLGPERLRPIHRAA